MDVKIPGAVAKGVGGFKGPTISKEALSESYNLADSFPSMIKSMAYTLIGQLKRSMKLLEDIQAAGPLPGDLQERVDDMVKDWKE